MSGTSALSKVTGSTSGGSDGIANWVNLTDGQSDNRTLNRPRDTILIQDSESVRGEISRATRARAGSRASAGANVISENHIRKRKS
jgi:hypothetical protein